MSEKWQLERVQMLLRWLIIRKVTEIHEVRYLVGSTSWLNTTYHTWQKCPWLHLVIFVTSLNELHIKKKKKDKLKEVFLWIWPWLFTVLAFIWCIFLSISFTWGWIWHYKSFQYISQNFPWLNMYQLWDEFMKEFERWYTKLL